MKKSVFLFLLVCFDLSYSFQTSSESVNPFNQFMSPSGGVNMFSGDVVFSYPVCSLIGRNGIGADVTLNYSSNVYLNVRARNDIAPTGWCGLGWSLNYGSVICDHKGTKTHVDDDFIWIAPNCVASKILRVNTRVNSIYYEGTWTLLPTDFSTLTPVYSGQCDGFDLNRRFRNGNYALVFMSNININISGDYKFYTKSDDGSKLYIDGVLVVNNDGVHDVQEASGVKNLSADKHTIRVEYFQAAGEAALEVSYEGPGFSKRIIPETALSIIGKDEYIKEYFIENDPYTTIAPVYGPDGIIIEWVVKTTDGKIFKYGSTDDRKATRKIFCIGNTVGDVSIGSPTLFPYQWDLSSVQDLAGNTTKYYYWQKTEGLEKGEWNTGDVKYTKESHIEKIIAPDNAYVLFEREEKINEAYDPFVFKGEPDGFIELYDQYRLKTVKVFKNLTETTPLRTISFDYTTINAADGQLGNDYRKSLLSCITEIGPTAGNVIQKNKFEYYADFNNTTTDYNYGAIKNITNLQGGKTEYLYKKQSLANTRTKTFQQVDNHQDLCFGTLKDGNGYCVVQYGENKDKLAIYNWDGGNWVLKKTELAPRGIGNYGLCVSTGVGYFVVTGGENYDKFWLYEWNGIDWQPCIEDAPGNYGIGHQLSVTLSSEHVAIACGLNKDKVCVYTKIGATWKMTLDLRGNPPWGFERTAHLSLGNNFLTVATGEHQDQIFVYNWDGQNWNTDYTYFAPAGTGNNNKNLTVSSGNNCFVVTGGENSDWVWVFKWDGLTWSNTQSFSPNGFHNESSNLIAVVGDNFIAITGGENRDKVWRSTFDGNVWSDPVHVTAEPYGSKSFEPQIGNNFFTVTGAANNDKVFVYRWNGRGWDETQVFAPEGTTNDNRHFKVYAGENYFVLEGGINTDKVWVYTHDGKLWHEEFYDIGPFEETKSVRGSSTQFGVRCGTDGDNLWLYQKFQDNFNIPIFSYVVDKKIIYTGIGNKSITTSYVFNPTNGNYDTRAGCAKYNKVETRLPGTGHSTFYFFNGIGENLTDQDEITADYKKLDGLLYKNETYSEPDITGNPQLLISNHTEYQYFYKPSWPLLVNQKREISTLTNNLGVISRSENLKYNDVNGLPYLTRTKNSNGKQLLTKTYFAFENSVYSITMGHNGANMLTDLCQTVIYEKAAGDNSSEPLPIEVRLAQATTWANTSGCNTWLPGETYKWKADFKPDGTLDKTFVNYDHETGAVNPNWKLTGKIDKYNSTGGAIQTSNSAGVSSTVIYNNDNTLPIASIANAKYDDCAVYTCDYNGGMWETYNNVVNTEKHFGNNSYYVDRNWGPSKNLNNFDKTRNYRFSAWVYPKDGNKIALYVERRIDGLVSGPNLGKFDFQFSAEQQNKWNLISCTVDKNGFNGMDLTKALPTADYLRIHVSSNMDETNKAQFYVDDIRFTPTDAMVSTTYYDPIWQKPIISVDANDNPSKLTVFDNFGRVSEIWKVDKTRGSSSGEYKKDELMRKEYHSMGEWFPNEYFRINTPSAGETLNRSLLGRITEIEWETNPSITNISDVKITIISDQHSWDIQTSTNNDGTFPWWDLTIDPPYTNCKIKISDVNNPAYFAESSGNFTIVP